MRSGDDPDTAQLEQWDPLWARWPMWSEYYIYTYAAETRIAEVTNLHRINVGWEAKPMKQMTLSADYHLLLAYDNPLEGRSGFGGGDIRGHLFTGVLKYQFNRYMAGHLWAEYFIPGNYYEEGSAPFDARDEEACSCGGNCISRSSASQADQLITESQRHGEELFSVPSVFLW